MLLIEKVLDLDLLLHVVPLVLRHLPQLLDYIRVALPRVEVLERETLDKIEPLLVVNVGGESLPELEDGGEVVLRVGSGKEVGAEGLSGDDRVEIGREAREEGGEHGRDLVRREEALGVLDEGEECGSDVTVGG